MARDEYLVVAIDGTMSESESYTGVYNDEQRLMCVVNESNTIRFKNAVQIPAGNKYFHHGPDHWQGSTGWDSEQIEKGAWNWLKLQLRHKPYAKVILVGHSRGGHIVANIAIRLSKMSVEDFVVKMYATGTVLPQLPQQKVHFLGLYDAVDMTTALGDTSKVPSNVVWFYHAMRSKALGSREAWGNTATDFESYDEKRYQVKEYKGTHGSMGGAVPSGCETTWGRDLTIFGATGIIGYTASTYVLESCSEELTAEENKAAGDAAHKDMMAWAKKAGVPVR